MTYKIYRIIHTPSQKCFVGNTKSSPLKMFKHHIRLALNLRNISHNLIHEAIRELGSENFIVETLAEDDSKGEAKYKERLYVKKYDSYENGFNGTSSRGHHGSIEEQGGK